MAAPSFFESVPKQELARSQLEVALQLYMQGNEYPAVITLAGAAEEVLGKIALSKGIEPSLKRTVKELVATTKAVWGREVKESDFAELRNRARNELKHFCSGDVPPLLSSTKVWSPIPREKEIGREEAIFGRTDHRLPA
jgi:hypothetical protein